MACSEAEDAGGLVPAKDDNEAARFFIRRTLPILDCVDYNPKLLLILCGKTPDRKARRFAREKKPNKAEIALSAKSFPLNTLWQPYRARTA